MKKLSMIYLKILTAAQFHFLPEESLEGLLKQGFINFKIKNTHN